MSTNRSRRIDRTTAEQLLRGATVDPVAGQDPSAGQRPAPGRPELAALLAAAAAAGPAGDGPLPGEEGAMAAFRQARRQPAPSQHRRRKMADTALARALSAKAMAVALGVTAVGGVAVAAGTGRLPEMLGGPAPAPPAVKAASASPSGTPDAPATDAASPSRTAKPSTAATRPGGASGRPSDPASTQPGQPPDLAALCRGFAARVSAGAKPKEAAADSALADLLRAAGTPERVTGYCAQLTRGDAQSGGQNGDGDSRSRPQAGPSASGGASPSASWPGRPGHGEQQSRGGGDDQD
ncbi:hypothetical protein [Kitasatospora griseola]|uniref:hypothetical protein n=1 Tax=Kitasatospora griseola TaxID=2064 RepID=UPI0006968AAF|nr:hypothetical protein [Kitasatospora griseola]